ncbi:MAG: hypothetical protein JKY62_13165 [Desulfocapsa sp.]|nr:hypothetical protein [Desulfocapsa sp.]
MSDHSEQITTLLETNMPEKGFVLESQSEIGSSVSDEYILLDSLFERVKLCTLVLLKLHGMEK